MAIVTLSRLASVAVDVQIQELSFALPGLRQYGRIQFWISRASPGWDTRFLHSRRSFQIEFNDSRIGYLPAVMETFTMDDGGGGATIEGYHVAKLFDRYPVAIGRRFEAMTGGAVLRRGLLDALAVNGTLPLRQGAFVECAPAIDYSFDGQPFSQVVNDVCDRTGLEAVVLPGFKLSLVSQIGEVRPGIFCEGGRLWRGVGLRSNVGNMASSVTGILPNGEAFTARL